MTGIMAFGAYIPRLRLDRASIYQAMGWFAPATIAVAQGERSMCGLDEDALTMAVEACRDCLRGQERSDIAKVLLASTTLPFADRQQAAIVSTALNLPDEVLTLDASSSQKAATSALISALETLESERGGGRVLLAASDSRRTKSSYFHEMWFGDGAASLLLGNDRVIAEFEGSFSVSYDFIDHFRGADRPFDYTWEERWARDEGYSKIVPQAVTGLLEKLNLNPGDITRFAFPCIFKAEHRKISKKLGFSPEQVADNMHEVCGETGVAHPILLLARELENARPGDRILMAGFGQGCDALCFRVTEEILHLDPRMGVEGNLARKKTLDNYLKFLKFRDLMQTEMGIRAEAPAQTALTSLWRNRKMLLGLVGGKCRKCGTAQFPKTRVCVNPSCTATDSQDDYEFAERTAAVKTFTGDMLAVSIDPPAIYGMIQFDGGGRFMADMADCELGDVHVGQKLRMSFRRHHRDPERGFSGYFWKAVPLDDDELERLHPPEPMDFAGKVAIVTGAGRGLGRAYALELAKRGAKIVVNDLGGATDGSGEGSSTPAEEVVAAIRKLGGEAIANGDSVSTVEGGEAIVQAALDAFGRVDVLVNNAGILRDKSFLKMEPEYWQAVLDVHLNGAYYVTRPAFAKMKEQGYGRIVMTTSAAGLYGNFGQANYAAAKMGLIGLMNVLAIEGARYDIKINTVAPVAASRLTEGLFPPDILEKLDPAFVASLVVFLCSEDCEVNGEIFNAGMGAFNRAAIVTGNWKTAGASGNAPTPEDIADHWEALRSLEGGEELADATAAVMAALSLAPSGGGSEEG